MSQTRVSETTETLAEGAGLTRVQVGVRLTLAAPVSGALCALGFLLVFFAFSVLTGQDIGAQDLWFLFLVWVAFAGPVGLGVGVILGVLPVITGVVAWPRLELRLGTQRAIEAVVGLVAALGWLQSLPVAWAFTEDLVDAAGWALGAAVVTAITARWVLRRGWRSAARSAARATGTY